MMPLESFKAVGLWFLPNRKEELVAGTLKYSTQNGLVLLLNGSFRDHPFSMAAEGYPIIHGVVSESPYGKFVTLFDSHTKSASFGMPGVSLEQVRSNHGFIGSFHVESAESRFAHATIGFSELPDWVGESGLKSSHAREEGMILGVDVTYRWPKQHVCHVRNADIKITFSYNTLNEIFPRRIAVQENVFWEISDFGSASAATVHETYCSPISRLMTLACDVWSQPLEYKLFVDDPEFVGRWIGVQRIYQPVYQEPRQRRSRRDQILFRFSDVADRFPEFMAAWFDFLENHREFCTLFFSHAYGRERYVETRFLFVMFALENLLRSVGDQEVISEFDKYREQCVSLAPHRDETVSFFPSTVEIAFPVLFVRFLRKHCDLFEPLLQTDVGAFIETLLSTYKHITGRSGQRVPGEHLYWLTERVVSLLKLSVLEQLGFSMETLIRLRDQNDAMGAAMRGERL